MTIYRKSNMNTINFNIPAAALEDVLYNQNNNHFLETISYNYDKTKVEFMVNIMNNNRFHDTLVIVMHDNLIEISYKTRMAAPLIIDKTDSRYADYKATLFNIVGEQTGKTIDQFMDRELSL